MNISVNFGTDVQNQQFGHRSVQAQQQKQPTESLAVAAYAPSSQSDSGQPDAPVQPVKTNRQDNTVHSSKTELQVNNTDYRIKLLIERQAGNATMQTVLNFYKIQPELNIAAAQHDVDVLA
ncbi:hypothetical protein [Neptunicella sp. SCSIO 80796]|uniref:hypothetical protein n=1 Tax=Neptunicella plasticusilytica TaxID=3117012 RepID=UPI003A4DADC5